ncbi:demethylmenaquinone methyltransferase/2-methoxy-6-polyprenyl-1,4-benzoquinol methylase [Nocardioides albertanoniae]|uniref:Demethylmenaquinone methyltransferase/2-methoxy-6-polyprenyl-1,4-benzoquinol methylase n=1 Tax=Nocardioides albertanoniae TaxID=1175486 RepID=A0A543A1V7_9ACTN|nr:ubiquinone/menaquinone biosynthesis methyltransferase [Nocardioides albertanoniae]TQL66554.1 demethylmenaquinone methyltransferase/2-methoxy-6-polyprenyl-1,4-benzoquinol methylase [Nocardioides albertanoniae]
MPDGQMPELAPQQVREMFTRVAPSYELGNTLMTGGMDRRWRRLIQRLAALGPDEELLDLATGTGQLALDARRRQPTARIVAADLTPEMLTVARRQPSADTIEWMEMDAHTLPFDDASFDVITHGYLLRYLVDDLDAALREQWRVLKPGGRLVALETGPGREGPLGSAARVVGGRWPRIVGRLIGSDPGDYGFLQESTLAFLRPAPLAAALERAGFSDVRHHGFLQGMVCVHSAVKR